MRLLAPTTALLVALLVASAGGRTALAIPDDAGTTNDQSGGLLDVVSPSDGVTFSIGNQPFEPSRIVWDIKGTDAAGHPSQAIVLTNFGDGTLSFSRLDQHLLSFGFASVEGEPQSVVNKTANDAEESPKDARFREVQQEAQPIQEAQQGQRYLDTGVDVAPAEPGVLSESAAIHSTPVVRMWDESAVPVNLLELKSSPSSRPASAPKDEDADPSEGHIDLAAEDRFTEAAPKPPAAAALPAQTHAASPTSFSFARAGDLKINGKFVVKEASPTIGTTRLWNTVMCDDFQVDAFGWSISDISSCGVHDSNGDDLAVALADGNQQLAHALTDRFLGGHCHAGGDFEAKKTLTGLPEHAFVRLTARVHLLDMWQGEDFYAKIDDQIVHNGAHHWCRRIFQEQCRGINVCGDDHVGDLMSRKISVVIPHRAPSITIAFGSTLTRDPCVASWGVDDVCIAVM